MRLFYIPILLTILTQCSCTFWMEYKYCWFSM